MAKKLVTAPNWESIGLEFMHGTMSAAELAKRHGLPDATVQKRAVRGRWVDERRRLSYAVSEQAHAVQAETRVDDLAAFNAQDLQVAKALRSLVAKRIQRAQQPNAPLPTPAELNALASTADRAQKIGRLALGVATENTGVGGMVGAEPIKVVDVPMDAYLAARKKVMGDF